MKKIVLSLMGLCAGVMLFAQAPRYITISVVAEQQPEAIPAHAQGLLTNKMDALLAKNGIGQRGYVERFIITASAMPLSKDIIGSAPAQIAYTLEVSFFIGDVRDNKVYASHTIKTKGVGQNEDKAMIDAFKRININDSKLNDFVNEGRQAIIDYYTTQAPVIFRHAQTLAGLRNYEEAFYELEAIPAECGPAYDQALDMMVEIYQNYVDYKGEQNLAKAKAAWAAHQNSEGAEEAGKYLGEISPEAACYDRAEELTAEIKSKVLDDWKFEMKKYQDTADAKFRTIEATREIGVAYGTHQQPTTSNILW